MVERNPARVDSKLAAKAVLRKKTLAFVVTCSATFLLTCTFLSMSVKSFLSESTLRLAVAVPLHSDEAMIEAHVADAWKQQLSDDRLANQINHLSRNMPLKHPVMLGQNFQRLRKSFDCAVVVNRDANMLNVRLTMEGDGSSAETALVSRLAHQLADDVSAIFLEPEESSDESLARSAIELKTLQDESLETVERLAEQIELDVEEVRIALSELETAVDGANQNSSNTWARTTDRVTEARKSLLIQKLNSLVESRHALLNDPISAEEANQLEKEIAVVRLDIDSLEDQQTSNHSTLQVIQNPMAISDSDPSPFRNASFSKKTPTQYDRLNSALDSIDTISLKSKIVEIKQAFVEQNELQSKQLESMKLASSKRKPAFVVRNVTESRSRPAGGSPSGLMVLSIAALSLLVGSVVAWGYMPLQDDSGFESADQVSAALNLPVLGSLERTVVEEGDEDLPLSNLVVQLARIVLLCILVIIAVGLIVSPSIRSSFVENPFHGLSQIMWNLLGK